MKTNLPQSIKTIEEAKAFLTELNKNGEAFHPEDDATDLVSDIFTKEEGEHLNKLMADIYELEGNNSAMDMSFDPCAFLLWLDMPEVISIIDLEVYGQYEVEKTETENLIINGWDYAKFVTTDYKKQPFKQPTYA